MYGQIITRLNSENNAFFQLNHPRSVGGTKLQILYASNVREKWCRQLAEATQVSHPQPVVLMEALAEEKMRQEKVALDNCNLPKAWRDLLLNIYNFAKSIDCTAPAHSPSYLLCRCGGAV